MSLHWWQRPALLGLVMVEIVTIAIGAGFVVASRLHPAATRCELDQAHQTIQHLIYLQFDNVHFTRDLPDVPSDLEQMPHLLGFLQQNGTLLTNHHTPLIAH